MLPIPQIFDDLFRIAFGQRITPFDYQRRLAEDPECKSRLINVPTGCGNSSLITCHSSLAWHITARPGQTEDWIQTMRDWFSARDQEVK